MKCDKKCGVRQRKIGHFGSSMTELDFCCCVYKMTCPLNRVLQLRHLNVQFICVFFVFSLCFLGRL